MFKKSVLLSLWFVAAGVNAASDDFSVAEKALFVTNQMAAVRQPATLHYRYVKSGSMEAGFEDQASIVLRARTDGACCDAAGEFLSGDRRLNLPEVASAQGNPVILYFLERDIREMQRLTRGQANYFRKRIRMAVFNRADVRQVTATGPTGPVSAQQITIAPYVDDPLRSRFDKLADKRYTFTLSDAVPGGVLSIRTQVAAPGANAAPLWVEELRFDHLSRSTP